MTAIISVKSVNKTFNTKNDYIKALISVDLEIKKGSFTVILGRSGSGKSTLLNLIAGLDSVSSGEITVNNQLINRLNPAKLAKYRSKNGIIFQSYNLLPNLNALENVMMGAWAGGNKTTKEAGEKLLEKFSLSHRSNSNVKTLSGGEKQRVAICRSLISNPEILFCDEPTGALDTQNELQVMDILKDLHKNGLTIVMVTHNPEFRDLANQIVEMSDGKITKITNK